MSDIKRKKEQLLELLKIHYGFDAFRPGQETAIDSLLAGKDTVVVMPTGGGKSLIFQLPALVFEGATLVVSPLISLMKDQVDSLARIGIPATFINSTLSPKETAERLEKIRNGFYKLVYIAPERFYSQAFAESLKGLKVSLFAIDEAHCISQWGHDFRPSYMRLRDAIKLVGRPPVVALTATATPEVRADIIRQLALPDPEVVITGFARPNLQFGVLQASDGNKRDLIIDTISHSLAGTGIVYVGTRSKADEIAAELVANDIQAVVYHAGLDNESRQWVQESFMNGAARVVVATNAFGLGINKKDIRFVIHHDLPGTIEAYYQEAGRAGRDGAQSVCLLLHSPRDRYLQEFFIKGDNPPPNIIVEIYDLLREWSESGQFCQGESLLLTYSDIAKHLSESVPEMAIGTALKILEREGYIARPNEKTANAFLKITLAPEKLPELFSARSKKPAELLAALQDRFGKELWEGWTFNLEEAAQKLQSKKEALVRLIKKLVEKDAAEYEPPFKGTEIQLLKKVRPEDLDLDFKALEEKLRRAYEKLEEMENYTRHLGCRQQYILRYFGEHDAAPCGKCDSCLKGYAKYSEREYLS